MAVAVEEFLQAQPSIQDYLRGVVLFGRNSASYKFALAKSLVELAGTDAEAVTLEDLAVPYAAHLCSHLQQAPRQGISARSRFLDICRAYNSGAIDEAELHQGTEKLGFVNVIDAFHVVGNGEIPLRFFVDERSGRTRGIRLTDTVKQIAAGDGHQALAEIEARWRLVETAWELDLSDNLIAYETDSGLLVPQGRRTAVTKARDALNGYQKGRCFYCYRDVGTTPGAADLADVDHVFPHVLGRRGFATNLDGVWNLVLACPDCNRGPGGKFHAAPDRRYVARLHRRNEYLIGSHHPLRETLIHQTGARRRDRQQFLQDMLDTATTALVHTWHTAPLADPCF